MFFGKETGKGAKQGDSPVSLKALNCRVK